tara:strand:- start:16402 stop:17034 length:633 start_codon:yes stop_codon:yes gene_type:complete
VANTVVPLGDLKLHLGIMVDTSDDVLESMCDGVLAWMEGLTQKTLNGVLSVQYQMSGRGGKIIYLRDEPVSLTSVEERDEPDLKTWTAYDAADYETVGRQLVRIAGTSGPSACAWWPRGLNNLRITYTAGYTSSTFPADLHLVVVSVMQVLWNENQSAVANPTGVQREKIGSYDVAYFQSASASAGKMADTALGVPVMQILARYTTISVQ